MNHCMNGLETEKQTNRELANLYLGHNRRRDVVVIAKRNQQNLSSSKWDSQPFHLEEITSCNFMKLIILLHFWSFTAKTVWQGSPVQLK